jgi:hypothetical protein
MTDKEECFVIMPVSDPKDYDKGHFQHVFDDIIVPACNFAGYRAIRASDVLATNFIHLDILKRILETPKVENFLGAKHTVLVSEK